MRFRYVLDGQAGFRRRLRGRRADGCNAGSSSRLRQTKAQRGAAGHHRLNRIGAREKHPVELLFSPSAQGSVERTVVLRRGKRD